MASSLVTTGSLQSIPHVFSTRLPDLQRRISRPIKEDQQHPFKIAVIFDGRNSATIAIDRVDRATFDLVSLNRTMAGSESVIIWLASWCQGQVQLLCRFQLSNFAGHTKWLSRQGVITRCQNFSFAQELAYRGSPFLVVWYLRRQPDLRQRQKGGAICITPRGGACGSTTGSLRRLRGCWCRGRRSR